jgi:hypothetical protein
VGAWETTEAQQPAAGKRRQAHAKELGLRETPPLWRKRLHSLEKDGIHRGPVPRLFPGLNRAAS